jgi:hypothetical protein
VIGDTAWCEKQVKWGEHRTEVTEVTEGMGFGFLGRVCGERLGFRARSSRWRSIHTGYRGGLGLVAKRLR